MKKYTLIFIYVCILILVLFELIQWIFWPKKFFLSILISNHTDPNDSSDINIPPLSTHHEIYQRVISEKPNSDFDLLQVRTINLFSIVRNFHIFDLIHILVRTLSISIFFFQKPRLSSHLM